MLNESQIITTTATPTMTTLHKRSFLKLPVTSRCPVSTHSFPSQPRNQWRCCSYLEIEFPDYFLHINRRPTKSFCWHSKSCLLSCACNILYVCSCGMDENQFTGIYVQGHILMLYLVGSCVSTCMAQGLLCSGQVSSMDGPTKSKWRRLCWCFSCYSWSGDWQKDR